MDYAKHYPSCIKVPGTKPAIMTPNAQNNEITKIAAVSNELIYLANRVFGDGKWSHTVTSQTLDFTDNIMGNYVAGCATFVRVQLPDGTFHEDLGYSNANGTTKGIAIQNARVESIQNAFKKVLLCFGGQMARELQNLENINVNAAAKDLTNDIVCSGFDLQTNIAEFEPCAQSTPLVTYKEIVNVLEKKSSTPIKPINDSSKENGVKLMKQVPQVPVNEQTEQTRKRTLSEEELLRMERKRKQMEKQLEYKRMMKAKEVQRMMEKQNPKY